MWFVKKMCALFVLVETVYKYNLFFIKIDKLFKDLSTL
jgi:hypothetical protein